MFRVFSHLGIMGFPTADEASDFFWALVKDIDQGTDGWVAWDEFFVDRVGLVCTSKVVEDLRKSHAA